MNKFDSLLPHCTVFLTGLNNNVPISTGTGFYYFFDDTFTHPNGDLNPDGAARIGIITNKHVVEDVEELVYYFNSTSENESGTQAEEVRIKLDDSTVIYHPKANIDLCVILTDALVERIKLRGRKLKMYPIRQNIRIEEEKLREMETIQDLVMIGYPRGIWDSVNNLPIIRKGINATPLYENYQGERTFAIDIASYHGSSGSPVFIYDKGFYLENNDLVPGNRLLFVGVLSSGHKFTTRISEGLSIDEMLHIGIAIKASEIDIFEELIKSHYGI